MGDSNVELIPDIFNILKFKNNKNKCRFFIFCVDQQLHPAYTLPPADERLSG
jgi:hypothetical protein